jgi:hypothetical protein
MYNMNNAYSGLEVVHEFIIKELENHLNTLKLKRVCRAIQGNKKKCNKIIVSNDPDVNVCKKHEKNKNIKLFPIRQNLKCIVYHNHLPNEQRTDCPRCVQCQ